MASPGEIVKHPYSPSWLNRFMHWIERRPGPVWPYYLGGFLLFGMISASARWLMGDAPFGVIDAQPFLYAVYPIYFMALMHYLDGEARAALARFRPALQLSDVEYAKLEYTLTTVPATGAWIATAISLVPGIMDSISGYEAILSQPAAIVGVTAVAILTTFGMAAFLILIYHTIRQLRMVSRIHAAAPVINLFQAWPAYAFSQLTARTGMGLILFAYFNVAQSPDSATEPITLVLLAVMILVAGAAFILPLLGMHQRLVLDKSRLESEINTGVEIAQKELHERVQVRNFAGGEDLDKVLSSLLSLREVVAKLPTWPWHPETLRGFLSALFLPILLWAITKVLERFIVF